MASYEDLLSEIRMLWNKVSSLKAENAQLREENAQLKERLRLNSKNSSKPPSSDQKSSDTTPKKIGGAKPGHPGHFRPLFKEAQVDKFVDLKATRCPTCGGQVCPSGAPPSIHQQVEIAPKPYVVTQYNRENFYCPCCRKYGAAPLPSHVGPSAFGTRLSAFMGFLTGTCRLSRRSTLNVLREGLGLHAAVGTQSNVEGRLSLALRPVYEEIEKHVRSSNETKYVDETGWKRWGKREFVWIMSTASGALYKIQDGRGAIGRDTLVGKAAMKCIPFVTDRLEVYHFRGPHQYCLAHLKRDIKRFAERAGLDGEWGVVMLGYLKRIFELWRDYREQQRTRRSFLRASRQYRDGFEYGLLIAAMRGEAQSVLKAFFPCAVAQGEKTMGFCPSREGRAHK